MKMENSLKMNKQQQKTFDFFVNNSDRNMFLSGAAGTGKSFVFKEMVKYCEDNSIPFHLVAPTAVAAVLVGGSTIHSRFGLKPSDVENVDGAINRIVTSKDRRQPWIEAQVIFIDEVSMMPADLLSLMDQVAKVCTENEQEFMGGTRVVAAGDFLQLGPVKGAYAFESSEWKCANFANFVFSKVVRQKGDCEWIEILEALRRGDTSNASHRTALFARNVAPDPDAVQIFCTNSDVDSINIKALDALIVKGARKAIFKARVGRFWAKRNAKSLSASEIDSVLPPPFSVCIGARVMGTRNYKPLIFNGQTGVVVEIGVDFVGVRFDDQTSLEPAFTIIPSLEYDHQLDLHNKISISAIPLRLAWACTVHRIQGATLTKATANVSKAFADGQVYTALSRCIALKNITIPSLNFASIKASQKCLEFYKCLSNQLQKP